jgi:hypothetical protein
VDITLGIPQYLHVVFLSQRHPSKGAVRSLNWTPSRLKLDESHIKITRACAEALMDLLTS